MGFPVRAPIFLGMTRAEGEENLNIYGIGVIQTFQRVPWKEKWPESAISELVLSLFSQNPWHVPVKLSARQKWHLWDQIRDYFCPGLVNILIKDKTTAENSWKRHLDLFLLVFSKWEGPWETQICS